nr:hypothetical protein [Nitrosomonas nitrosa]
MIAARLARVHETFFEYAKYLKDNIEAGKLVDPESDPKVELGNAIHHMMEVPKHFSVALKGDVADAYFQYRILTTCGSGYFAVKANDYNGIFPRIFFSRVNIFKPEPVDINKSYKRALRLLGRNIWQVAAYQNYVAPWTKADIKVYTEIVEFFEKRPGE